VAQSSTSYDEAAFPLLPSGSPTGWIDPATSVRGNATSVGQWLNTTNAYLQTHAQYDQFGNLRKSWDARDITLSNPAQIEYSSTYQFAYPTTMTSSVPDPSGQYGSSVAFVTTTVYDTSTGFITSTTDPNNQTTTFGYTDPQTGAVDPLNRIRTVTRPDGGLTTFNYNDTPGSVSVQTLTKQDATTSIDTLQFFDGLGRPSRSFLNVGSGNYNTTGLLIPPPTLSAIAMTAREEPAASAVISATVLSAPIPAELFIRPWTRLRQRYRRETTSQFARH
jgi:hypothetical protein